MAVSGIRSSIIVLVYWALAGCASVPRINGTSDKAFDRSYANLVEPLSSEDRLRLSLAEGIVLTPRGCLSTKMIAVSSFSTNAFGVQSEIKSCRRELHGLSFQNIIDLAYPHGVGNAN